MNFHTLLGPLPSLLHFYWPCDSFTTLLGTFALITGTSEICSCGDPLFLFLCSSPQRLRLILLPMRTLPILTLHLFSTLILWPSIRPSALHLDVLIPTDSSPLLHCSWGLFPSETQNTNTIISPISGTNFIIFPNCITENTIST